MAYLKIEIDPKLYTISELGTKVNVEKAPVLLKCVDGTCRVYLTNILYLFMSADQAHYLTNCTQEGQEFLSAPNHQFSEGFILRALAIAQNPSLAKDLV